MMDTVRLSTGRWVAVGRMEAASVYPCGPDSESQDPRPAGEAPERRARDARVLRIVHELGQQLGLHIWCHGLRQTASRKPPNSGNAPAGLDKIRTFSRRRTIATLMIYVDEHDRQQTEKTLGALVAGTLTS